MKEEAMMRKQNTSAQQAMPCAEHMLSDAEHMLSDAEHMVSPLSTESQSTICNPQSPIINPQTTNYNSHPTNANPQSPFSNPQASLRREPVPGPEFAGLTEGGSVGPSFGEVRDYILREGLGISPEDFMDYYTANGWTIGGAPVRDWKAVARRWGRKEKENERQEEVRFGNYG